MRSGLLALAGVVIMSIDATDSQVLAAVVGFVRSHGPILNAPRPALRKWEAF
jgi:hypothetical protein